MAAADARIIKVPPVLCSARVIEYAVLDDTVTYTGRHTLYVGGEELGPVPCLAICQNLDGNFMYLAHCDKHWNVLGASGSGTEPDTIEKIKMKAEEEYRGSLSKWQSLEISKDDAIRFEELLNEGLVCGFCYQIFATDGELFHGAYGTICPSCVEELYKGLAGK